MTLDITIVNIALPNISNDLDANLADLQWVINAYTLAFAALLLVGGSLADRFGNRTAFAAGAALFTFASIVCGAAPNLLTLEIARAVQGVGAALVFPAALALIANSYEGRARQTAIGIFSAVGAAAGALGPLAGGALVEGGNWRWIFLINIPVGVLIVAGAVWRLAADRPGAAAARRLDLLGAVIAIAALFLLNLALVRGPDIGWGSVLVTGAFVAAAVLLVAFLWVEARQHEGMLDLALFGIPAFSGTIFLSLVVRIASFGMWPFLILWLQGVLGHSAVETGVRFLAMTMMVLLVAPFTGRLQSWLGAFWVTAVGFAIVAVALLSMARVRPDSSWTVVLPGFVLLGIGVGLALPPLFGVAVSVVPPERAGMASGAINTFFPLGTAIGVAVLGAVFASQVRSGISDEAATRAGVPPGAVDQVRTAVEAGGLARLPTVDHPAALAALAREAFTAALADVFVTAAFVSMAGVVISCVLALVRNPRPTTTPAATGSTISERAEAA
jgi:EmrB/QacA subfamily drug resistance transporter